MAPTLEELLARTPLPTDANPYYNGFTVTGTVPACGADDDRLRRILVDPNNPNVYFPRLPDVVPNTTFLNIDDPLYRRILTATGSFRYQPTGEGGRPLAGTGILRLCRSENPLPAGSGRYELFITNNSILSNAPRLPNMLDQLVGVRLSDSEIVALVRGSGMLDQTQYAVSQDPPGIFFVTHNRTLATNLASWVENDPRARSLFPSESRRGEISRAIRANVEADEFQFMGIRWGARWQPIFAMVGGLAAVFSIGGMVYMAKLMKQQMQIMSDTMRGGLKTGESALEKYGRDLTRLAREGRLPTVLGREAEMRQLTNILGKRQVANPLLVGPPGSGKSAIVEGLAQRLVRGELKGFDPANTRIVEINQEALKAEAGVVGQYEARVRAIMQEIGLKMTDKGELVSTLRPGERVILFIDEIHNANREPAKGVSSLMAQLKPFTSRGDISLIGATTNEEVHILTSPDGRQDSATGRRFDTVNISAMTAEQSLDLLVRNRATYETDGIRVENEAFREAVVLTDNFKPQQHFPDKSIQLIDLVVSTARSEGVTTITPEYVRNVFSVSSGLSEEAMTLELQLRGEEAASHETRMTELRNTSATEYLTSRNVEAARVPAAVREAIRLWDAVPESEKMVYISHETNYREGTIPTRFLERNLAALRVVSPSAVSAAVTPPPPTGLRVVSNTASDPARDSAPRVVNDTTGNGNSSGPRVVSDTIATPPPDGTIVRGSIIAENVLMPRDAAPLESLSREVIKAQIVLTYREYYMSQAGRDALSRNEPLPTGDALINSDYRSDVNDMADSIIREYSRRGGATGLAALWDAQRARGFLPRGGVPEGLVTEICGERIAREHREGLTRYSGTFTPDAFSREATERLSNTESFRSGMVEATRHLTRGGR